MCIHHQRGTWKHTDSYYTDRRRQSTYQNGDLSCPSQHILNSFRSNLGFRISCQRQRKMLPLWGWYNYLMDVCQHPGDRACDIAGGCPARRGDAASLADFGRKGGSQSVSSASPCCLPCWKRRFFDTVAAAPLSASRMLSALIARCTFSTLTPPACVIPQMAAASQ